MGAPTIQINNGTGSDSAASGAGPATALTGTAASTSASGLVVTLDGSPDLSGVLTDGSHVVWVNTPSGRQFAAITAKDNTAKTVTTTIAYAASLTGQAWAIGGKRATLDNAGTRKLFSADAGGWVVDLQETGTNYALTTTLSVGVSSLAWISTSTNYPRVTTAVNSLPLVTFGGSYLYCNHIYFSHTATTRGTCLYPLTAVAVDHVYQDCVFDGFSIAVDGSNGAGNYFSNPRFDRCEFKNNVFAVVNSGGNAVPTIATRCFFHDNTSLVFSNCGFLKLDSCAFARNSRAVLGSPILDLRYCAVHGCTDTTTTDAAVNGGGNALTLIGNVFYGNAHVTAVVTSANAGQAINAKNAYGGNLADRSGLAAGAGDVTLTADPFTAAASNDFTLNATAGGGALLRGAGSPASTPGLVGSSSADIGPFQSAAATAGAAYFAF